MKRKNSNSVTGICLALENTKHIDFLNLSGSLPARTPTCPPGFAVRTGTYSFGTGGQPSISHGVNLKVSTPHALVLTGRDAHPEIIESADTVSEIREINMPTERKLNLNCGLITEIE